MSRRIPAKSKVRCQYLRKKEIGKEKLWDQEGNKSSASLTHRNETQEEQATAVLCN